MSKGMVMRGSSWSSVPQLAYQYDGVARQPPAAKHAMTNRCPKCGVTSASVHFVMFGTETGEWQTILIPWWGDIFYWKYEKRYRRLTYTTHERIVRECPCGFMWCEWPIDAPEAKAK